MGTQVAAISGGSKGLRVPFLKVMKFHAQLSQAHYQLFVTSRAVSAPIRCKSNRQRARRPSSTATRPFPCGMTQTSSCAPSTNSKDIRIVVNRGMPVTQANSFLRPLDAKKVCYQQAEAHSGTAYYYLRWSTRRHAPPSWTSTPSKTSASTRSDSV